MQFEAVIFDCDGVLVDSEVNSIRGERAALADFGLDYSPEDYVRRFVGMHDGAFEQALVEDYQSTHGSAAPSDFFARILEGRRRESHRLQAVTGAADAMAAARSAIGMIGVASSSRAHYLKDKLSRFGLFEHAAPHVYSADLVAHGKPAPDIFLYTAEKLTVDPARCLVLEDSENGVRAGVAAGMTVWGFLGGGHIFDGHGARLEAAGASQNARDFTHFIDLLHASKPVRS